MTNNVIYDEDHGMFTLKNNSFFGLFNFGDSNEYEKDITIQRINELKKRAGLTTLGDDDIDILYNFTKLEYKVDFDKNRFINIPLKELYADMGQDKLNVNKLMIMAYDYLQDVKKGKTPIIEKFSGNYVIDDTLKIWFVLFLFVLIMMLLIVYCKL